MNLTSELKEAILKAYEEDQNLDIITRKVFKDESLSGKHREGRLVRSFLISQKKTFKTRTKIRGANQVELTEQQKQFAIQEAEKGLSSLKIAEVLFPDKEIKPLSAEQRAVYDVVKEVSPEDSQTQEADKPATSDYIAPKAMSRILKKVNDATGNSFEEAKINRNIKICLEKLGVNLNNSRFITIINNYPSTKDRELFEQEFIRLTWDKPDLSSDEINLYLNVCKEIINLEVISKHLNKLNEMFDIANEQDEMSVRLAEIIKAKSAEYHQCETRIENLTKKLQGDRAERMKNKQKDNVSLLALVQFFQDEEERSNMVRLAEMQKKLVREYAQRMESMEEWRCRVLGLDIEDVV